MIHGTANWPGVSAIFSCSYTCSLGITPSVAMLLFPIKDIPNIKHYGDLAITDGRNTLTLKDCAAGQCNIVDGPTGGRVAQISISDRRWQWRFGYISATFNRRNHRGEPLTTLYSPYDIAEYVLKTFMGESDYLIDLPAGLSQSETPLIEWDMLSPAQALMQICDQFARVVVFQPIANRVVITKPGEGQELPQLHAIRVSEGMSPTEVPTTIEIVGAPIVYQAAIRLRAAGRDIDEQIKLINDLSFKPTDGWGNSRNWDWYNVNLPAEETNFVDVKTGAMSRTEVRKLAESCVWKYWRITLEGPDGQPLKIPGLDQDRPGLTIDSIFQIELFDKLLFANKSDPKFKPFGIPLQVFGSILEGLQDPEKDVYSVDLTAPFDSLRGVGFSVDNDNKLLISDRPIYSVDSTTGDDKEPDLIAVVSFTLRDQIGGLIRYRKSETTGSEADTAPQPFTHDDVRFVRMVKYDASNWSIAEESSNREAVDQIAQFYSDSHKNQYRWTKSKNRAWPGIVLLEPDGAIRQITWSVGGMRPTTTEASLNGEHAYWLPSYEQLKFQQRIKYFTDPNVGRSVQEIQAGTIGETPGMETAK